MPTPEIDEGEVDRLLQRLAKIASTPTVVEVHYIPLPDELSRQVVALYNTDALQAYLAVAQNEKKQIHLVVLVHGINTHALWMGNVQPALEAAGFAVAPTSYGAFGVPRFLIPYQLLTRKAIERVITDIRTAIRIYDPAKISVISHSFGTYVVGRILIDHPDLRWHRIIFCGSVVRDDFPFHQVVDRFDNPLVNEVGTQDFWPAIAESVTWGYGSVGSNGFNRPPVKTRWHLGFTHSDFLTENFCKRFWIPFLRHGLVTRADSPTPMPRFIRAITALRLRWMWLGMVIIGILGLFGLLPGSIKYLIQLWDRI